MTQLTKQNGQTTNVVVMRRRYGAAGSRMENRMGSQMRCRARELREASTGQVVGHLPRVWAGGVPGLQRCSRALRDSSRQSEPDGAAQAAPAPVAAPQPELAFYRKYTQALLRRYMRLSLEAGRVPSLMGREMFRGNVTHYRVHSFEDVVIFCHDVEKRLAQLGPLDRQLVKRIGLQQYTQGEAAGMLGLSLRNCVRLYAEMLDRLTSLFLEDRLLEPQESCQEGKPSPLTITDGL